MKLHGARVRTANTDVSRDQVRRSRGRAWAWGKLREYWRLWLVGDMSSIQRELPLSPRRALP